MAPRPATVRRHPLSAASASMAVATLLGIVATSVAQPAPPAFSIDGEFDEWRALPPLVEDPRGDAAGSQVDIVDITAVRGRADGRHLSLLVEVVDEACLQGLDRPLELMLDADGDPGTGAATDLLRGLDLIVVFSPVDQRRPDRPGQAVGLEVFGVDARQAPNAYALDLHFAPSHASDRFEIRLERGSDLPGVGRVLAGRRVTGRLIQRAADGSTIELTEPFTVEMPPLETAPPPAIASDADPLAPRAGALRVMSWNAEQGVMIRKSRETGRLIAATEPDILLLQEFPGNAPATDLERILEGATEDDWTVHLGRGGGNLRCVVATRLPGAVVTDLDPLPLPDTPNRDVRTAARMIEHAGGRVLALSVHLKCCGRPGDSSDLRRIEEAEAIRDAMAAVIAREKPDAVVIAGDLNLVGSRTPLNVIASGLDVDRSDLLIVDARQPGPGATNATWYDEGSPFTPGRLDFVLVSDGSLTPATALVLNGRHMLGEAWTARGLQPDDTLVSDHFPILVDLDWNRGG
jgi:endonuclease/exonuclease/phosphatase family metal-dependent hydrolase